MEKPVEELIHEIDKNNMVMAKLLEDNRRLSLELKNRPDEDWDWVSVAVASKIWNISLSTMYSRITKGDIKTRKFESKLYVSLSDIKNINDSV